MIHNDYIMIIPNRSLLSNQKTFKPSVFLTPFGLRPAKGFSMVGQESAEGPTHQILRVAGVAGTLDPSFI